MIKQTEYLSDFTLAELENRFASYKYSKFRARQIWQWFYQKGISEYDEMTNLSLAARKKLKKDLPLLSTEIAEIKTADDKSEKRIVRLYRDNDLVETVWIPMGSHATICVSTQIGCPVKCSFCASGADGYHRNLSAGEIVEQVWHSQLAHTRQEINNLVFMGMGEPLLNYDNLIRAIKIFNDPLGFCIGARKMTVSTVGILPKILTLANEMPQVRLAVSLHATNDNLRKKLIPGCPSTINDLLSALKEFHRITKKKVTYEYVLFKGINDSMKDAAELVKIVKLFPSKVNLIEYNDVQDNEYQSPDEEQTKAFSKYLYNKGVNVVLRKKKGDNINAACGQLRRITKSENEE